MFTDAERAVFEYFDGEKVRYGDPLAIRRRLILACAGKFNQLWDEFFPNLRKEGLAPERAVALVLAAASAGEAFVPAARAALELKDFNPETGGGATEAHVEAAVRAWAEFCEALQKKTMNCPANSPTS